MTADDASARVELPANGSASSLGGIQVVGTIPVWALCHMGWHIAPCEVGLHPAVVDHISDRRSSNEAYLILTYLRRVVEDPHLCGPDPRDTRRILLVHFLEELRGIAVALKLVRSSSSASGTDELWVSTGYLLGHRSLTRLRRRRTFIRVDGTMY